MNRCPRSSSPWRGTRQAYPALQFSPNGKLLASGGNDNTVCVWDVEKRKLLKTLRGHAGRVRAVAFAPQLPDVEAQLLTASHDQSAKVWNLKDYEEFPVFGAPVFAGHQDAILGATFSPDNNRSSAPVVTARPGSGT